MTRDERCEGVAVSLLGISLQEFYVGLRRKRAVTEQAIDLPQGRIVLPPRDHAEPPN
jgi:hypothetical protein